jgi:hypothetical protein
MVSMCVQYTNICNVLIFINECTRFEVLTAVFLIIKRFWDVTPCLVPDDSAANPRKPESSYWSKGKEKVVAVNAMKGYIGE